MSDTVTDVVNIRRATTDADLDDVADMWTRSSERLQRLGYDQWSYPVKWHNILRSSAERKLWVVSLDHDRPIATITLENEADDFWLPENDPEDALYAHRLVVDDGYRGTELGSALLDWAARRARAVGKTWLRLDAWKSNTDLHKYYLDRGFTFVRIAPGPDELSGACFQRRSDFELHRGPHVREEDDDLN